MQKKTTANPQKYLSFIGISGLQIRMIKKKKEKKLFFL